MYKRQALMHNKDVTAGAYKLEFFDVHTTKNSSSTCVVKLSKEGNEFQEVSLGEGPINAAYNAVDKITGNICEEMSNYSIHSTSDGNDSLGEVTVRVRSGKTVVLGRGLSSDIIEASILAYVNGINKLIEIL